MNARVAAIQTKTFLEADEQKRNIERAGEYVAEAASGSSPPICPTVSNMSRIRTPSKWLAPFDWTILSAIRYPTPFSIRKVDQEDP